MCEEIEYFLLYMLKLIILVQCMMNKAKLSTQKLNFNPALIVLQINTYQFFMDPFVQNHCFNEGPYS